MYFKYNKNKESSNGDGFLYIFLKIHFLALKAFNRDEYGLVFKISTNIGYVETLFIINFNLVCYTHFYFSFVIDLKILFSMTEYKWWGPC